MLWSWSNVKQWTPWATAGERRERRSMLNLASYLDQTAKKYPDAVAVMLDSFRMTYAELDAAVKRVANVLVSKGIERGDRVAMMIPNTPHFPMLYYGILQAGATVVPVNVLYTHEEIGHYLSDSGAKLFFTYQSFEEEARKAFADVETCRNFIVVGPPTWLDTPEVGENFMHLMMAAADTFDVVQTMPDDTAVLLYTSGTTGSPKGAELTHFNMFFNALYSGQYITKAKPGDIALCTLPLFHSFGQTCLMNAGMLSGAALTMLPRFETKKAMEVIARDKVSLIALVPTMYFFILDRKSTRLNSSHT